ncbi:hypothetical protein NEOLEDRAFT_1178543 [Neolentinus lepideus HHB14362 ss-1]|uniref:Nuclear pore complex protein Nup85 n=1 Tax=Neolentinus lepideus HHB14362 ss-1 TaxID=1314782 RepID=A0A165SGE7_9AGAM|nr:hypothetical protein NEOLEDRAFT_1178543 [Neolentinus lepideus HHB14362 ss-1]
MTSNFVHLVPPLVESGNTKGFDESGRTLGTAFSPRDNSLATFVAPNPSTSGGEQKYWEDAPLYFANPNRPPDNLRRQFISEAGPVFDLLAALRKGGGTEGYSDRVDTPSYQLAMHQKCRDLVNVARSYWIRASQQHSDEEFEFDAEHYRSLHTCLSLANFLYAPSPESTRLPVGDDLMEWLNMHYIAPSTEEGDHLSNQISPWKDETFWPYLTRAIIRGLTKASIFFLEVLSRHPSSALQELSQKLVPLLQSHPQVRDHASIAEFSRALSKWKENIRALRLEMGSIPESDRDDGFENWWDRMSDILSILEGRFSVLKHVCQELGADWKEICAAYATLVHPTLSRSDLPEVAADVLDDMPPDPTDLEDSIHVALVRAEYREALARAACLDPWLAAHLAIVLELLAYVTNDRNKESELSIADYYLLAYAEYLGSDPGLWRWNVSYLCSCGDIGREMADAVLVRVPLKLGVREEQTGTMVADENSRATGIIRMLKEITQVCRDYERLPAMRTIYKIGAGELMSMREYALAMECYAKAADWSGLGRCVDLILEEFISGGPAKFVRLVENTASLLQELTSIPETPGIFLHRLTFAVRYAEFHDNLMGERFRDAAINLENMFRRDTVPKSWWALLLCDCVELLQHDPPLFTTEAICLFLQKLEEIQTRVDQGWADDYLSIVVRTTKGGGTKDAFQRLKRVRLATARFYAKCSIIDIGGKGIATLRSTKL